MAGLPTCEIVDTVPAFLAHWLEVQDSGTDAQVQAWLDCYGSGWPELVEIQVQDYASRGEDWHEPAIERIFPTLAERLPRMRQAHGHLPDVCAAVLDRAGRALGYERDIVCVIHVGLGCGAGWATQYAGRPALLFGLENVAEEGWQDRDALTGLVAHEVGHLVHSEWRGPAGPAEPEGPWWQLYSEGFAQVCADEILGGPSMHPPPGAGWQEWCEDNRGWLATEFLRRVDRGDDLRPFFGSWFDLRGHKQTGYFLGHRLVAALRGRMTLREAAGLTDPEALLRPLLREWADGRSAAPVRPA